MTNQNKSVTDINSNPMSSPCAGTEVHGIKYYFRLALMLLPLVMLACDSTIHFSRDIESKNDGLSVRCHISKINIKNVREKDKKLFGLKQDKLSFVYADITLTNTRTDNVKYDLNEYFLYAGNSISSGIYIDSVASQLIVERTIKPGQEIKASVYWVFDGVLGVDGLSKLEIIKNHELREKNLTGQQDSGAP